MIQYALPYTLNRRTQQQQGSLGQGLTAPVATGMQMFEEQETESNVRPITQTLKIDPVTGEQTLNISGRAQDLQTIQPVQPQQMAQARQQQVQQASLGQGLTPPVARPATPEQLAAMTQSNQRRQQVQARQQKTLEDQFVENAGNFDSMYKLARDNNLAVGYRMAAASNAQSLQQQRQLLQQAEQKVQTIQNAENPGMALSQMLAKERGKPDEGSVLKAYLYQRLGLQPLADQEYRKLGAGQKWKSVLLPDNTYALVKFNSQGLPLEGYSNQGPLTDQQLINAGDTGTELDIVGGTFVSDTMKDEQGRALVGRFITNKRTARSYIQTDQGRMPVAGFRPQSSTGSMEDMRGRLAMENQFKFLNMTAEQRLKAFQTTNDILARNGLAPLTLAQQGLNPDGSLTGQQRPPATQVPQSQGAVVPPPPATQVPQSQGAVVPPSQTAQVTQRPAAQVTQAPAPVAPQVQAAPVTQAPAAAQPAQPQALQPVAPQPAQPVQPARPKTAAEIERQQRIIEEQQKSDIGVSAQTKQEYQTKFLPDLNDKAGQASTVVQFRRQLQDLIFDNPDVVGYLSGEGSRSQELRNVLRDVFSPGGQDKEAISKRIAQLRFDDTPEGRAAKAAVFEMENIIRNIAPTTLKAVAGAGSVSEAEQKANRETIGDPSRLPLYTTLAINSRDMFNKELTIAERDWASKQQNIGSGIQHSTAWSKEKKAVMDDYIAIVRARNNYIRRHYNTAKAVAAGFKLYPAPTYSADSGWSYPGMSQQLIEQRRNRPALSTFNR